MKKRKTLLIGWDGADWPLLHSLIKKGMMPTLSGMLARGVSGPIATLDPPLSPMLWTTVATGVHPSEHGILGFAEADEKTQRVRAVRGTSSKVPALWDFLNQHNISTNVVGWWPSHPAEAVKGAMVSNFFPLIGGKSRENWPLPEGTIHPKTLGKTLAELRLHPSELTEAMLKPFFPDAHSLHSKDDGVLRSVMQILAQTSSIHNAATWLMENEPADFTAVYYDAIDHFSHLALKFHPPRQAGVSEEDFKKYHYIVEAAYRFHDMMLERLLTLSGPDTDVILLSDHGFKSGAQRLSNLPEAPFAPAFEHSEYGVFIAAGPSFCKNKKVYGSSLLDVAPTVLQLYGIKPPESWPGRSLQEVFVSLPRMEKTAVSGFEPKENKNTFEGVDTQVISNLEALGYVNLGGIAPAEKARHVLAENRQNLARNLLSQGRFNEALDVWREIYEADAENINVCAGYGLALWQAADYAGLIKLLQSWPETHRSRSDYRFLRGIEALATGQSEWAESEFSAALAANPKNGWLRKSVARIWLDSGFQKRALEVLAASSEEFFEDDGFLETLAEVYLANGQFEAAVSTLADLTERRPAHANAHQLMATALENLGLKSEAASALEAVIKLRPGHVQAKFKHAQLTGKPWPFIAVEKEEITVVTGFPRSGTSLTMQLLRALGFSLYADGARQADASNPQGYFESEAVKDVWRNPEILREARGKAVKVVFPLVRFLPPGFAYRFLVVKREPANVVQSQQKMMGQGGSDFPLAEIWRLQREEKRCIDWLQNSGYPFLEIRYEELLAKNRDTAQKLSAFLGCDFPDSVWGEVRLKD